MNVQSCFDDNFINKFWSLVNVQSDDECWEWQGYKHTFGYGLIRKDKQFFAHRLSWIFTNGDIPEGMYILHTCDNPPCCNPKHLWLGTHEDNVKDMNNKRRNRSKTITLTQEQIQYIKENYVPYKNPLRVFAEKFEVSTEIIRKYT